MPTVKQIKTVGNRDVELLKADSNSGDKTVLIIGVFHGDEPQGEYLIRKFMSQRKEPCKNQIYIIPCLNPDGKALGTRQNANGIDLNRNFPTKNRKIIEDEHYFGGTEGGSEIETQFIIDVLKEYKPDFILTIHAPYRVVNFDGNAEKYAKDNEINFIEVSAKEGTNIEKMFNSIIQELLEVMKNNRIVMPHGLTMLARLLHRLVRNIVMGLWVMALLISSSIVCTTDMTPKILGIPALGVMGYVFACIIVLYTIVKHFISRR